MQWTAEKANQWYAEKDWLVGFNFVPSTAVNSTEMWQNETYDSATIDKELELAAKYGFNTCRVFLPFIVWEAERAVFMANLKNFVEIAQSHGISVMPILFDDCAFAGREPYLGQQDPPTPGVTNSGWTPSPGPTIAGDSAKLPALEEYVKEIIGAFKDNETIVCWDLYNEPGNDERRAASLPLLENAFAWAREINPSQPLTTGIWDFKEFEFRFAELSDVISFHNYEVLEETEKKIELLKKYGRPIICTEWLNRGVGNSFENHLPVFRSSKIGSYHWGLVAGKIQTYYGWDKEKNPIGGKPEIWMHDLFDEDWKPYNEDELRLIRKLKDIKS